MTMLPAEVAKKTFVVERRPANQPIESSPRSIGRMHISDVFDVLGAGAASIAITILFFGWLEPLSSGVGFVIFNFFMFVLVYAATLSLKSDREEITDKLITVLLYAAGIVLLGALIFVIVYTLGRGVVALPHINFFTKDMSEAGPLDPLTKGGILHAILGTLTQIGIALLFTIPLGITTAVFLNEIGGRFARLVRTIADAMTALPSVVAGLFVLSALIRTEVLQRSGFAAAIAITVMMLPIVIRASDVVLRLVPNNLREASYALGTSRWRTVWHVVLPTSRSGLVTAVILGTARGIGETSPVLLTSGISNNINFDPFKEPMISLPLQVFTFVKSPEPNMIARGFGTAATLLVLVLLMFAIARAIGGKAPGQLSARQNRQVQHQSRVDIIRITLRDQRNAKFAEMLSPKRKKRT